MRVSATLSSRCGTELERNQLRRVRSEELLSHGRRGGAARLDSDVESVLYVITVEDVVNNVQGIDDIYDDAEEEVTVQTW